MIKVKGSEGLLRKNSKRYLKKCLTCDEKFYVISALQRIKYCSHKCYWQARKDGKYKIWNKGIHIQINNALAKWRQNGGVVWNKGKKIDSWGNHSDMDRKKMSDIAKKRVLDGEHNFYRGGTTNERDKIENTFEYKQWRQKVFERDDWTCQICNQRGGCLNADHIKPFSLYPDLRLEISNGRTLCQPCHQLTDTFGAKVFKVEISRTNVI